MIGRTNSLSSGNNVKLFTPSGEISNGRLTITDRNGDFCTGFLVYTNDETLYRFERDERELFLPNYFEAGDVIMIVSLSNVLENSDPFHIRYEEQEDEE